MKEKEKPLITSCVARIQLCTTPTYGRQDFRYLESRLDRLPTRPRQFVTSLQQYWGEELPWKDFQNLYS